RVADGLGAEELSVGDFVLSGGEPAALCVLDAVVRLLPGALGDHESAATDSHYDGLLSPPSYTRPPSYRGMDVPAVLLSGDHEKIAAWRAAEAARLTRERRPDLWAKHLDAQTQEARRTDALDAQTHRGLRGQGMDRLRAIEREGVKTDLPAFDPGGTSCVVVGV